ncbi:restriction endonuclease subunit S [Streptococcus parasuis]|uniref:restriction endonuclease subunit S n=1 Tax=Streptococcus parasuis TaxID=1501662 RepID=UPI00240D3180|nr:restriction endonuclease subunit S [Streptococcus parasuis]WFB91537.1 restriction endonuclease subunit S [Streptococcus parasuis]
MPNKDKNIPKRRFKEFENADAWELRKLNNIADVRDGTHNSPRYIEFGYTLVTSKNIKNGQVNFEDIQYISSFDYEEINKRSKVNINDILMGMIGTVGNLALVREEPKFAIKNVALIKNIGVINVEFLYHYLGSYVIERQLQNSLDGGTQKFISLNKIRHLDITFPTLPEQEAIGTFFSTLDSQITLHQRKLDKLKSVKQAYLSEMFPAEGERVPKRCFPGFTDAWELRKLGEFVDKAVDNRGKTPPLDEEGTHPLIEVAALGGVHPDYTKIDKYLNDESFENNLRSYVKKDDILFTTVGSIGLVSLMDSREEAAIAQNIVAFRAKDNFVPSYLYSLFTNKENQKKAIRIVMGAVQPSIKVSQLVGVEYMLTQNRVEQEAIGTFFSTLDQNITLHQRKLEKLKNLKKALLNELFV